MTKLRTKKPLYIMHKDDISINGISRRNFVRGTSMAAGAIVLGSLPVSASAFVAGNETLKLAVVGCGGRGTGAVNQALSGTR